MLQGVWRNGFTRRNSFTAPRVRMYSEVMPPPGMRLAYGPGGERTEVPFSDSVVD
jgi:hypothetical protein